jgi:hypothetical protein
MLGSKDLISKKDIFSLQFIMLRMLTGLSKYFHSSALLKNGYIKADHQKTSTREILESNASIVACTLLHRLIVNSHGLILL